MKLKAQLHILSREAVNYGLAPVVMEEAVNPVLAAMARQLKHLQYYVVQNSQGDWLLTTLAHRRQPQQEKRVIYAFATEKMALSAQKYVSIMTIFYSENIAEYTISSQWSNEISLCLVKFRTKIPLVE